MSKRNHHSTKPGDLGPAFHEWLAHLEYVETMVHKSLKNETWRLDGRKYAVNDELFKFKDDEEWVSTIREMIPVDAYLARIVRSSVKYRADWKFFFELREKYEKEMYYLSENRELHLPHEWCSLVVTGVGPDDILISAIETTAESKDPRNAGDLERYPELGCEKGEKFISLSAAFFRPKGVMVGEHLVPSQKLAHCPVEVHFNKGKLEEDTTFINAYTDGCDVTPKGKEVMDLIRKLVVAWIQSFNLSSALRERQIGIPATRTLSKPQHKARKIRDQPKFEHFICQLEVDQPEPEQTGLTKNQPKKKMHRVHGFWRHYQKPLKHGPNAGKTRTYVEEHWRGDESLGVIVKDHEVVLHDE